MYLFVVFLPFIGFLISGVFGRFFGRKLSIYLSTSMIFLLFLFVSFVFYEVCIMNSVVTIKLSTWLLIDILKVRFGFLFDDLTAAMLFIISIISFFVHLYSIGYLDHDPYATRFFSFLSLFTFFMILLVTSDNFLQLFFGWEGVGLCSYFLISFWFTRIEAVKAALKAMIMNRISDVFLIFGITLILLVFKTTDIVTVLFLWNIVFEETFFLSLFDVGLKDFICFCFFVGCVGKSAQLGLHTWLPDAMEGPTPVSSLLHAATMVTAGVFLLLRCSTMFESSALILLFVVFIGGVTAFFSSTVAVFHYDIKKVIAYSTCSQLGYMFFSCGLSNHATAAFHLFNHAFFKALLFLCAGSVIHALLDEQDMRKMGSLAKYLPFTYIAFVVGSLAITGFPFLTGFYSKELLLEFTFCRMLLNSLYVYLFGCVAAFFTSVYSIKLLLLVFYTYERVYPTIRAVEGSVFMLIPIFFLVFASLFVGFVFSDFYSGLGSPSFEDSFYHELVMLEILDVHFLNIFFKNLPFFLSLFGITLGIYYSEIFCIFSGAYFRWGSYVYFFSFLSTFEGIKFSFYRKLEVYLNYAGYFNNFYNSLYNYMYPFFYKVFNKTVDKGIFEFFGPYGVYFSLRQISLFFKIYPPSIIFFSIGFMFFSFIWFVLYVSFVFYLPFFFSINAGFFGFSIVVLVYVIFFG